MATANHKEPQRAAPGPLAVHACKDCGSVMHFVVPDGIGGSFVCRCDVGDRNVRRWRLLPDLSFVSRAEPRSAPIFSSPHKERP